jgi:thiol:disulfide interchange protein DsbD
MKTSSFKLYVAAWLGPFVSGLAALALIACAPAFASVVTTPHATTELAATTTTAPPGGAFQVAVAQTFDKGWHSYWRNPGDAGEATTIHWTLPTGWTAGPIAWPAPRRLPVGPIMNYGYEGGVVLPVVLRVPADARPGSLVTLSAVVDFLVCAEVCVPDTATVSLSIPVAGGASPLNPIWAPRIDAVLAAGPKAGAVAGVFTTEGRRLRLAVTGAALAGAKDADAYFYPYDASLIDHAKPQTVERGPGGLILTLAAGPAFDRGAAPASAAGVLEVDGRAFEINASAGRIPASAGGLGAPGTTRAGGLGLPLAALFAFIGGLILNLMPCVFPILSMKAAALAGHAGDVGGGRRQALAFLVGVLAAFLTLAGLLIAARAAGAAVGWGFQLQSPRVVALLSLVMLAAALNLSGLFEIGTSAQGLGSGLASRSDLLGSAFTGVLAVVVAAPCTAPFMGTALGFALTQNWTTALLVFAALGLGFAAPFTLLAFSPPLTRLLPRPGAWMETFRKALAFPMYAAAAWLVWVLAQQTDPEGLARALAAAVLLGLAAWLVGGAQRRSGLGTTGRAWWGLGALALALCLGAAAWGAYPAAPTRQAQGAGGALAAQPWSPERLASLRAQGRPVLVNFTAAWCVTCQVNERAAFSTSEVAQAFKRSGAAYLVADWTNRNAAIAQALEAQGRVGVPLYLVYGAGGGEPNTLPQLLTPGLVVGALDRAAANR